MIMMMLILMTMMMLMMNGALQVIKIRALSKIPEETSLTWARMQCALA